MIEGENVMSFPRRDILRLAAVTAALPAFVSAARAQTYPTRTVHIIVPLGAGSAADILTRQLAQKMSESWGRPVVVENRPGAGTVLGAGEVARAAPDGHTLLANSASFAISAVMNSKLPYDPLRDFAPISQIALAPMVLVVAPSLGVKSIKALIELAKTRPGEPPLVRPALEQAPISRPSNSSLPLVSAQCTFPIRDQRKCLSIPLPSAFNLPSRRCYQRCHSSMMEDCSPWG